MKCNICLSPSKLLFEKKVLQKHNVKYFRCVECGCMFTEKPYWLAEAYSEAITATDLGLVKRNLHIKEIVERIILLNLDHNGTFLDFAGGYGLLVRMLRDDGFDFYRQDEYCKNIFAVGFDIDDLPFQERNFQMVTAFEVFEHLEDPVLVINKLFGFADVILFSTELLPSTNIDDWWYLGLNTGQHVSFFTLKSLQIMAKRFDADFYSDEKSVHVFVKNKSIENPFAPRNFFLKWLEQKRIVAKKKKMVSLLMKDVEATFAKVKLL